jgi:CelD/BcsL family acetyltransferase involved in cellulose biosynthesis
MEALPIGGRQAPGVQALDRPEHRAGCVDTPVALEGLEALDQLAPAWSRLADEVAAPPHWRPEWVRAWWKAFGRGRLELVTVRRGNRLVGVAPMQRRNGELRSTSNYHTPSYGFLASDPAALGALATALIRASPRRLTVAFLPQ